MQHSEYLTGHDIIISFPGNDECQSQESMRDFLRAFLIARFPEMERIPYGREPIVWITHDEDSNELSLSHLDHFAPQLNQNSRIFVVGHAKAGGTRLAQFREKNIENVNTISIRKFAELLKAAFESTSEGRSALSALTHKLTEKRLFVNLVSCYGADEGVEDVRSLGSALHECLFKIAGIYATLCARSGYLEINRSGQLTSFDHAGKPVKKKTSGTKTFFDLDENDSQIAAQAYDRKNPKPWQRNLRRVWLSEIIKELRSLNPELHALLKFNNIDITDFETCKTLAEANVKLHDIRAVLRAKGKESDDLNFLLMQISALSPAFKLGLIDDFLPDFVYVYCYFPSDSEDIITRENILQKKFQRLTLYRNLSHVFTIDNMEDIQDLIRLGLDNILKNRNERNGIVQLHLPREYVKNKLKAFQSSSFFSTIIRQDSSMPSDKVIMAALNECNIWDPHSRLLPHEKPNSAVFFCCNSRQ